MWHREVSAASSAVFRIAFGVAMIVNALLYIPRLVGEYYVDTSFSFAYGWFTWIEPLPAVGMYAVYAAMVVAGALVALGLWYRAAIGSFFLLTTYVFLLDSTFYQNHEYLISLLALLMFLMPLDGFWSLDARRRPQRRRSTVPMWVVWTLRFQIGVPYFFGGIAKLNGDWFAGEPLRAWLAARTDIEPIATVLTTEGVVWCMAYGALVLDLVAVPLLLWRRTRLGVFVVLVAFHVMNAWLFGLFIFPWLMIAATTVFFDPDWPIRLARRYGASGTGPPVAQPSEATAPPPTGGRAPRLLATFLAVWVAIQLVLPLRHVAIPGNPNWTEEGHRFAWHMMLRSKTGSVTFEVDTGDAVLLVDPRDHLGSKQTRRLAGHPQRLAQFANWLSDQHDGAAVRARTEVSLNGRARQPIVDPGIDLARVPTAWTGHQPWILPLEEPLPRDAQK